MLNKIIKFFLENKLITFLFVLGIVLWGISVLPFNIENSPVPRNPVPVDAIPDIGENQQIVFTEWMGRSPQDVEDQITYPLAIALQGILGVKTIRSFSMFGFSTIYIIFDESVEFYWSRSRILERLSTAQRDLPEGVVPTLGPDATALGQIFWYTLEGEGFELDELRSIQDWYVKYGLQTAKGVSEVASVGGYVKEYQIDIDPDAMRIYNVSLQDIMMAVRKSNIDVGARTIDFNNVEYVVRGIGLIKSLEDIEKVVVKVNDEIPIYVSNVAKVQLGPALRRGALDKEGAEVVGGVVVVRFGENPMEVIQNVKDKIVEIEPGLPEKVLPDGRTSKVEIVPFYDRTQLIDETLGTLSEALMQQILVTIIVILVFLMHFRSSLVVSLVLPAAVLMAFIMMKLFNVDANIMSLAGIAIAIGTIVDMGIIMVENIIKHLEESNGKDNTLQIIYNASIEVGSAILTAIMTTIVSFMAVFTMTGPEGKLFKPLAYTKTFALFASVLVALFVVPALAHIFFSKRKINLSLFKYIIKIIFILIAGYFSFKVSILLGIGILIYGLYLVLENRISEKVKKLILKYSTYIAVFIILIILTNVWMPLGYGRGFALNFIFIAFGLLFLIFLFFKFIKYYPTILMFFLNHKLIFSTIPLSIIILGITIWLGFPTVFSTVFKPLSKIGIEESSIVKLKPVRTLYHSFPGLGKEFMPQLDEGSFLLMPTTMPHASIGEALDVMQKQNILISQIPEVESVVGKIGRAKSPLDPAPISMIETVINYKPEYGERDPKTGRRTRQWREHIQTPDDIWNEILKAADISGTTSAPRLQPIAARIVMLQSGMRAPMGVKISGQSLEEIEKVGLRIEELLKDVPGVQPASVFADRIVGKPYLEFHINREKAARYGANIRDVQDAIEMAVGGMRITTTVDGRERYAVRIRYLRELRDSIEEIQNIIISTMTGQDISISKVATLKYTRGPQVIRSEDAFLVGYVLFDKKADYAEVSVVNAAQNYLQSKIDSGELVLPPGTSYRFAGNYEHQVRSEATLKLIIPLSLLIIFLILYFQFKSVSTTMLVFLGITVAFSGGFILIWLYSQEWFGTLPFIGDFFRQLFNMGTYNLSVAVWVGFLALMPILTSTGRGADVMIPMALPSVGGMLIELLTLFVVPVGYCWIKELQLKKNSI